MPQLMPLNWIFSSMMLVIVMVSACVIYGEKTFKMLGKVTNKEVKNNNLWFW